MGDDHKDRTAGAVGKNKTTKESSGRHKDKNKSDINSVYSGSYISRSSHESSGNSDESDDDRHDKRKHYKRTKRDRTKRGKITKARGRRTKQMDRQRKKQTSRLAEDLYIAGPSKAKSTSTVMSKASTTSTRSAYSNDSYTSERHQKKFCRLGKEDRRLCVSRLLRKLKAARKPSLKQTVNDKENKKPSVERMDEEEDEGSNN